MPRDELVRLGKYELVTRLARGGMAEILLARQPGFRDFSRLVVIKRLLPQFADRPQVLEMFVEEARLASQINHRNVIRIFDVGKDGDTHYIAMEYIDGISISALTRRARRVKHGEPLPPFEVSAEIIAQACDGLHAAHELCHDDGEHQELVHRDISPQNLMIDRNGTIKLLDFGIAKARGSAVQTRTGSVKGKFPYMSPEQCRGEPLDRRSDLFALGSLSVELLTGQRPFERSSELETIKAITKERIQSVHELNPDVPAPIGRVVDKAHTRERKNRYETAADMAEDLRKALDELDLRTSPETLVSYLETDCVDLLVKRSEEISMLCADDFSPTAPTLIRDLQRVAASEAPTDHGPATAATPPAPERPKTKEPGPKPREPEGSVPHGAALQSLYSSPSWMVVVGVVILVVAGLVGSMAWVHYSAQAPTGPPLVLACPPYFARDEVLSGYAPLAEYLSKRLDRPVDILVMQSYSDVVDGLIDERFDIATLSPLPYIQARDREPRLKLIAAETYEGARTYQALVITSTTSTLSDVRELEGKRFCYVDESSTSGYLLPRHYLRSKGLDPDRLFSSTILSGTHEKVMEDVIAGRCDAGAIYSGALIAAQSVGIPSSKIRMLAIAGESSAGMIVGSPTLSPELTEGIGKALIDFNPQRDLGRSTVSTTFPIDGFIEVHADDFAAIEAAARAEGLLDLSP